MSTHLLKRFIPIFFCLVFISGCAGTSHHRKMSHNECKWNPSSCMYEGSYEPDEREYAEQQAKDLNKEASRKLRRRSIWNR